MTETSWHLSRNFTIGHVLAVVGVVSGGIIAFNTLEQTVANDVDDLRDHKIAQAADQIQQVEANQRDREQINELKTQTAVIQNTIEIMQRTLDDNRQDIKEILTEVKRR
jgi:septal ring factor EnvC (AmiA/AmiB activator)